MAFIQLHPIYGSTRSQNLSTTSSHSNEQPPKLIPKYRNRNITSPCSSALNKHHYFLYHRKDLKGIEKKGIGKRCPERRRKKKSQTGLATHELAKKLDKGNGELGCEAQAKFKKGKHMKKGKNSICTRGVHRCLPAQLCFVVMI